MAERRTNKYVEKQIIFNRKKISFKFVKECKQISGTDFKANKKTLIKNINKNSGI